jgi:hypothetical protein
MYFISPSKKFSWFKAIVAGLFSVYFIRCIFFNDDHWCFIDGANLVIHELGHFLFLPFGQFIYVLGGSLFQIIVPLAAVLYFYRTDQRFSGALTLFWLGESIVNVSIYARDAVVRQLPLITGDIDSHDWHYLLSELGWLSHTEIVANAIFGIGVGVTVAAIILSLRKAGGFPKLRDKR